MAKKKVAKKATKKAAAKPAATNKTQSGNCSWQPIIALVIIVLTWWAPSLRWSQIVITILAILILFSGNSSCKR